MPAEISWYVEELIVYDKLVGSVTQGDLRRSMHAFENLTREVEHPEPIHLIVDLEGVDCDMMDINLKGIANALDVDHHTNIGWVLLVDARSEMLQKMSKMIMTIISQTFDLRYRYFTNPEDAIMFLATIDDRVLDWLNHRHMVSYRNSPS